MLVDPGASVSIMSLATLVLLRIDISQLTADRMMLKGFNESGERAMGSITLSFDIDGWSTEAKFHIIDADTSFNALLGRPWIHEHRIVPSSLHQCLKYVRGGIEHCVKGNLKPFSVREVGIYEDASYYLPNQQNKFPQNSEKEKKFEKKITKEKKEKEKEEIKEKEKEKLEQVEDFDSDPQIIFPYEAKDGLPQLSRGRAAIHSQFQRESTVAYSPYFWNTPPPPVPSKPIYVDFESDSEDEFYISGDLATPLPLPPPLLDVHESRESRSDDALCRERPKPVSHSTPTPLLTQTVDRLVVKEALALDGYSRPQKFVMGTSSPHYDIDVNLGDEDFQEIIEIPFNGYSQCVKKLIKENKISNTWPKKKAEYFNDLWDKVAKPNHSRAGIGFGTVGPLDEDNSCLVISNCLDFTDPTSSNTHSYEEVFLETVENPNDFQLRDAPPELEEEIKSTTDELREINLGTEESPRPTFISSLLNEEDTNNLTRLLFEFKDCFAWSYEEMPGLAPEVAVHKLEVAPGMIPIKQGFRRMRLEVEQQVISEVKKLIDAGFIREEKYPTWLSSVVPVKKKNGQIRVCVDFRDLNKACPKDEFPLPIPELMVDIASSHTMFSFMDGSSGYNQIRMAPEDEKLTAFRTPLGVYCYRVMPFGLKNAGATYQRAMTRIFDELIHHQVECYVDDLVVKSLEKEDHLQNLRTVFERLRQYSLKMNPLKCAFGVSSGKFLGFVVRHRGIEIDPDKIKAILEMSPPKSLTQLRSFQGRLAYLRRFISNLSGRCRPFSALNKKEAKFKWDEHCQQAFEEVKKYLMNPPVLAAPIPGKSLILYTAALDDSLGALLAQVNEEGKENALYYLSRRLIPTEINYPPIEKHCLALIFAAQKLRHYMLSHKIDLISRINPLQYLVTRPTLSGRLARWSMILSQFDITFVPLRAVKGQALADFLAAHPLPAESPLNDDLPDETIMNLDGATLRRWELYFDGAASSHKGGEPQTILPGKAGIGLVFLTPNREVLRFSYHLSEPCTNNEAEYEALIAGLEMAISLSITSINIYGDSQLVISQIAGSYRILKPRLLEYKKHTMTLLKEIPEVTIYKLPRIENAMADALAKLAKELACPDYEPLLIEVQNRHILAPIDIEFLESGAPEGEVAITEEEEPIPDWRLPIFEYISKGTIPRERSQAHQVKQRALSYAVVGGILYRRSYDHMWLRCLGRLEAQKIVNEVHSGLCGAHQSGPKMKDKIKRLGYYWPSMITDCMEVARKCHQCQVHGVVLHQPPNILHPTVISWPFECWGTDIVGPIDPPSSKGHRFILAATDYFSKWAEAIPLREVKAHHVLNFFKNHIVYRFGVPRRIISDNGSAFRSTKINNFTRRHGIDWRYSTIYYPKANGLAEAFNKTLVRILKRTLDDNKRQWHEQLTEALWAYRTTCRTPTQSTPFALVYGSEAVLPLEVQLPSLRIAVNNEISTEQNARLRLEELEGLEGRRLMALQNLELYQARMVQAHSKLVRPRTFRVGELVLVLRRPIVAHRRYGGKFEPTWEGPFIIERAYQGGSYQLVNYKGERPMLPINGVYLKKYYV